VTTSTCDGNDALDATGGASAGTAAAGVRFG